MPALDAAQRSFLRRRRHRVRLYATFLNPRVLWTARVNDGGIDTGARSIDFDTGAGDHFDWIEQYQTIYIGSAPGEKDLGKGLLKSVTSGDGGVTGTLEVAANSIFWEDDAYVTFLHNYELFSEFPRLGNDEVFYKLYDRTYSDENENIYPMPISGPHRARFHNSVTGTTHYFYSHLSYAMAPGASIATRTCTILPDPGGIIITDLGGGLFEVIWPAGDIYHGQYWVKITATDTNGKSRSTWRSVWVHSFDPVDSTYPNANINTAVLRGGYKQGGWSMELTLGDDATLEEIPDGTLAVIWAQSIYGDAVEDVSFMPLGTNLQIAGYVVKDQFDRNKEPGGTAKFTIATIDELLRNHFLFSVSLESRDNPEAWWQYLNGYLSLGHIAEHFWGWHSTLFQVADVFGLDNDGGIHRKAIDIEEGDLYTMMDSIAQTRSIKAHFCSDKMGRLWLSRDIVYRDAATRAAAPVVHDIEDTDFEEPIMFVRAAQPTVCFVFYSGVEYDGADAEPVGSTAPTDWPSAFGKTKIHVENQMIVDQADSNRMAGQIMAVENNPLPEVRVKFAGNWLGVLEPAFMEWWRLTVASGDTIRGIVLTDMNMICRDVTANYDLVNGTIAVDAVFEPEVEGKPGVPYSWPSDPPEIGGGDPDVLPADIGEAALLTASSLYFQPYGESVWDLRTTDDLFDAGLDPFWHSKASEPLTAEKAVVFTGELGQIRRSTDSGNSFSALAPGDPPNTAGDGAPADLGDASLIQYLGNPFVANQHIWLVTWENAGGIHRSWHLMTDDDGSTWLWSAIL